jgi:hypothetical protein
MGVPYLLNIISVWLTRTRAVFHVTHHKQGFLSPALHWKDLRGALNWATCLLRTLAFWGLPKIGGGSSCFHFATKGILKLEIMLGINIYVENEKMWKEHKIKTNKRIFRKLKSNLRGKYTDSTSKVQPICTWLWDRQRSFDLYLIPVMYLNFKVKLQGPHTLIA